MVTAIESDESGRLNSPILKQITGGDTIAVRFLYQEHFEDRASYKIILVTNDKPYAQGEDTAIWERLKLIPFNQFIPPEERIMSSGI